MNYVDLFRLWRTWMHKNFLMVVLGMGLLSSCNTIEKASIHGFNSGYYKLKSEDKNVQDVYLDVTGEQIDVYRHQNRQPEKDAWMSIPLKTTDSLLFNRMVFKKQSLDVDITSILLKYRPTVYGLPAQLTTDLNIALYAGWRHDYHQLTSKKDPLGRSDYKMNSRGFDVGFFAGPGTTVISPFTTRNKSSNEYSGMIIQTGIAGFVEFDIASFGFAVGYDYLPNADRKIWIYNNKPWLGFIVGVALN